MAGKKDKVADKDRTSIIVPSLDRCMVCGTTERVCIHEVFHGTAGRVKSKEDAMCVPLCFEHHQGTNGVHNNKALDLKLKQQAQRVWMQTYCDEEDEENDKIRKFISRYGKNYL